MKRLPQYAVGLDSTVERLCKIQFNAGYRAAVTDCIVKLINHPGNGKREQLIAKMEALKPEALKEPRK